MGAANSSAFSKVVPSAFASLSASVLPFHNGFRFVFGLEARAYFGSTVDVPEFSRRVPAANSSVAVILGGEFPSGAQGEMR